MPAAAVKPIIGRARGNRVLVIRLLARSLVNGQSLTKLEVELTGWFGELTRLHADQQPLAILEHLQLLEWGLHARHPGGELLQAFAQLRRPNTMARQREQ